MPRTHVIGPNKPRNAAAARSSVSKSKSFVHQKMTPATPEMYHAETARAIRSELATVHPIVWGDISAAVVHDIEVL